MCQKFSILVVLILSTSAIASVDYRKISEQELKESPEASGSASIATVQVKAPAQKTAISKQNFSLGLTYQRILPQGRVDFLSVSEVDLAEFGATSLLGINGSWRPFWNGRFGFFADLAFSQQRASLTLPTGQKLDAAYLNTSLLQTGLNYEQTIYSPYHINGGLRIGAGSIQHAYTSENSAANFTAYGISSVVGLYLKWNMRPASISLVYDNRSIISRNYMTNLQNDNFLLVVSGEFNP
jgi:hypothetical protein